jgi:C-terminal processing protease CtpA/Prc
MMAHACILERELAAQKEQFRVLEDEMLVLGDERNAAELDAKENTEIANEFKGLMEQYRQREAEANKALRLASRLLSEMKDTYFGAMSPDEVLEYLIRMSGAIK